MSRRPEATSVIEAAQALVDVLGSGARMGPAPGAGRQQGGAGPWDAVVRKDPASFGIQWKAASDALRVGQAIRKIREAAGRPAPAAIPVLAVPFMGEVGRRLCAEAGLSWIDLCGNAWVDAPGITVRLAGRPNRFRSSARPLSVFSPRGSRVVRALLLAPGSVLSQRELVERSGIDKGRVSRIVRQLVAEGQLIREEVGYRCADPDLLLQAWREGYDFGRHRITRGILGARSSDEVMQTLARAFERVGLQHAMTGLAGAWLLTRHATFRIVTVLLGEPPPRSLLADLGLLDEPRGANVWLAATRDDAPFLGARTQQGIACAHPIQVYLDLKAHPERSAEAAEELRRKLPWRKP